MKKVVILKSRAKQQGGLEKAASRIASAFKENGDEVTILSENRKLPFPSFIRMELFDRYVQKWLRNNRADIVFGMERTRFQTHYRAGNGVHAAYLKSRILTEGKLKYWSCILNPMHRKILELEKAAFENPQLQKLFTNSDMVKREILDYYETDPAKIQVIHNGVEWSEMEADFQGWEEKRKATFKQLSLPSDRYHFLFIGNGYLRKGLGVLLDALFQMKRRDFHLSVIGKDKQLDQFKAKAALLGLNHSVTFFGPRNDIRIFYQMADALIIPSFYDPFANVTVEALAMGLKVVSSKQNGGSEVLKDGIIIPDLLDRESIVQSLEKCMSFPKTRLSSIDIRNSVQSLDYSRQMKTLIEACG